MIQSEANLKTYDAFLAKMIATLLGLRAEELEKYRQRAMEIDDLSCCGKKCSVC